MMYYTGHDTEADFDEFAKTLTWDGHVEKLDRPYLCAAGKAEELGLLEHTERFLRAMPGPKRYLVYQESRHAVGHVPSANLGPNPPTLIADWMADRLAGKSMESGIWYVRSSGVIEKEQIF